MVKYEKFLKSFFSLSHSIFDIHFEIWLNLNLHRKVYSRLIFIPFILLYVTLFKVQESQIISFLCDFKWRILNFNIFQNYIKKIIILYTEYMPRQMVSEWLNLIRKKGPPLWPDRVSTFNSRQCNAQVPSISIIHISHDN